MSEEAATLYLAKLRESHTPDEQGRQNAGKMLFEKLREISKAAGLEARPEPKGGVQIGFHNEPWPFVSVSTAGGDIFLGKEPIKDLWVYDPVQKAFVGNGEDAGGPSAIELLAKKVGSAIEDKLNAAKKASGANCEGLDDDEERRS